MNKDVINNCACAEMEQGICLDRFESIVCMGEKMTLSESEKELVKRSYEFLSEFSADKVIYGINTGFGPMAQYRVSDQNRINLQYNIIRSHSAGTGQAIPSKYIKGVLLVRLSNFLTGHSGVHPSIVNALVEFINRDILPVVYEHGSVGASGDLVQLAHVALALIGEGEVMYKGKLRDAGEVLREEGLEPIKIYIREGLSLLNGTSVMTGIGLINVLDAKRLYKWAAMASGMMAEITSSFDDYFSRELNESKLQIGQRKVAQHLQELLSSSQMIRNRNSSLQGQDNDDVTVFKDKIQEHYSLRCVPQILGPVLEVIENCERVLVAEMNSASDNPIVDLKSQNVYHGGNFHGDYVSLEMDKLKIAITRLAMLCERQMNYLFHDKINDGLLPPFGNMGVLGFNYGLQACQFTATSTTAECQTLSFPNYIHSIPNNNDNQDIVSMGTNSALMAKRVLDNAYQVLSVHFMALVQAVDYLQIESKLSTPTREAYQAIRALFPLQTDDTVKYKEIEQITEYLKNNAI